MVQWMDHLQHDCEEGIPELPQRQFPRNKTCDFLALFFPWPALQLQAAELLRERKWEAAKLRKKGQEYQHNGVCEARHACKNPHVLDH
jgi:hypothetical protein